MRSLCNYVRNAMSWTCPEIIEICVGMEITSYEAAEV